MSSSFEKQLKKDKSNPEKLQAILEAKKKFKEITEHIISGGKDEASKEDIKFIKEYIDYINNIKVIEFPKESQSRVVDFIAELKQNEEKYLVEISPRMTIGFMRLCKGLTRLEGREQVTEKDLSRVKEIVRESLKID